MQPALGVQSHELLHVFRVNAAMIAARLPGFAGVVTERLLLNPNCRSREKINAAQVIPMRMADDDVRDFFRLNAGELDRFVGTNVSLRREVLEESIAVIAAVK